MSFLDVDTCLNSFSLPKIEYYTFLSKQQTPDETEELEQERELVCRVRYTCL